MAKKGNEQEKLKLDYSSVEAYKKSMDELVEQEKEKIQEDILTEEEKLAKIRQTVAERETTPTQPSKSYENFKQYIETIEETVPQETQEAIIATESAAYDVFYMSPILCGVSGFVLGALVAFLACRIKIRQIKAECETKVSEARATLDRMISVIAKE